jgi:RNA polymerase sigma factor (sigma-70 family)
MDDLGFVRTCLRGDKEAWDEFVDRYSVLIYNYIHSVFKNKSYPQDCDTVNDIYQEIFLCLVRDNFRKLRQFKAKNGCSLASWLRTITINFTLDYLRRERKVSVSSLDEKVAFSDRFSLKDIISHNSKLAQEIILDEERIAYLSNCIGGLSEEEKYFLQMHIYCGMSLEDLRGTLGISRAAVDMRKNRILKKLRNCFREKGLAVI